MLDDYQDLIDELLGTPALIRTLFATAGGTLPEESVAAVSALHERDTIVLDRLQRLTREPSAPYFKTLPPLDAAIAAAPIPDDPSDLLGSFDTARGDLVSLLMNLTLKDWERIATDDVEGEISLAEEVERHVEFDEAIRARL
ncbi:MAG: hypothetical protein KC438_04125 [Thermomicrobiales bacterium]|nr:hypothetical protein [Thermomicrobiales bacterium]MCO5222817.1 hypothetical protein [Thermomicrobiales bacterium]